MPERRQDLSASVPKIVIAGAEVKDWIDLEIKLEIDSLRTATISTPFIPGDKKNRARFEPFTYKPIRMSARGKTLITGYAQSPAFSSEGTDRKGTLACISLPGVLTDCTPPIAAFPMNFKGQKLDRIAARICKAMGIKLRFTGDPGAAFDEVALDPGGAPFSFLADLAQLRGFLVADDADGNLTIKKEPETSGPVLADLTFGIAPVLAASVKVDGGAAFSDVTAWRPTTAREPGGRHTVKIQSLSKVRRPYVFRADSTEGGSIKAAAEAKAARMFPEMISWDVEVAAWDNLKGALWSPGAFLTLYGPEILVYNRTKMLIRSVTLRRSAAGESAALSLVLPGAFSGAIPKARPWA
jgi:prophage tail gpP-like protein